MIIYAQNTCKLEKQPFHCNGHSSSKMPFKESFLWRFAVSSNQYKDEKDEFKNHENGENAIGNYKNVKILAHERRVYNIVAGIYR